MEVGRAVDGYAHQPVIVMEKAAPLLIKEGAVGLQTVEYGASVAVALLKLHSLAVKIEGAYGGFAAMPRKHDFSGSLSLDIAAREQFKRSLGHKACALGSGIDRAFVAVIAVGTSHIAGVAHGLHHAIQRA